MDEALKHFSWKEDHHPGGKAIESIEIYVLEVFDDRDPVPNIINVLHTRTRHWVIKTEVIPKLGEVWNEGRVLETERNLRSLRQLSLANVVAVYGSSPEKIRLVVVVKDVWSLRMNSDWAYGSDGLDMLLLNPTEENLAGIRASIGAKFLLERDRYSVGGNFLYPRMFGSLYSLGFSAGVINNRHDGEFEGGYGSFSYARPLYSRRDKWAYGTGASWLFEKSRVYQGGEVELVALPNDSGEIEVIPRVYESEAMGASYWAVRSWGYLRKFDLGLGIEVDDRRYRVPDYETISSEVEEEFEDLYLPVSDRRISPYVNLSAYSTGFHRVLDVESLELQEDWRLGYGLSTTLFSGAEVLGSSRNLFGVDTSAGYTLPIFSGFLRAGLSNRIVVANEQEHEAFASARGRFVSPSTLLGRLHLDSYFGYRYQNYLNVSGFRLGGDNRLRGYPTGWRELEGVSMLVANAEFRSSSVDILSAQVGLAAFYDVGAANDVVADMEFYQGIGGGLRVLFPQAERTVMRLDWGFPLNGPFSTWPGAFYFTFGQAFSMPSSSGGGSPF